jgi:hypothetical protein
LPFFCATRHNALLLTCAQVEVATDYIFDKVEESMAKNPVPESKKEL